MTQEWAPSAWGRLITRSPLWRLRLVNEGLELSIDGQAHVAPIGGSSPLHAARGVFWSALVLDLSHAGAVRVDGLPKLELQSLEDAIASVLAEQRRRRRRETFGKAHGQIRNWLGKTFGHMKWATQERRWITHEQQQAMLRDRPTLSVSEEQLWELFRDADARAAEPEPVERIEEHLKAWRGDWPAAWARMNEQHVEQELIASNDLFDHVESKPLTQEQARAVICFDNRVQVVASAGSGKTSTMVAKAAYAIQRGFMAPERIVLLAFNKKAAEELQQRAELAFQRLGMEGVTVAARTFHALGLGIVGKATGRKPDVPGWAVDTLAGLEKLNGIVDRLKDQSDDFRTRWDMFRLVFGRDLPRFGAETSGDEWDKEGNVCVRTLRGDRVRSDQERLIADWLFYNGVDYEYERSYEFDTATADHRQYRPDFYYPGIALYHEHLALNAEGQAPPQFAGYLDGVAWKREEHVRRGTALVETTSHQAYTGQLFAHLGAALTARGVVLDPNPDRPIPEFGQIPLDNADLVKLVRTFISHAKSNSLGIDAMTERLEKMPGDSFKHRHRMFLGLVAPILQAWDAALAAEGGVDFEDMLNQAAEYLEQGRCELPYDLVMADEFQDASRARARLCRALVQKPGRHLFAVGDDWQSINRFAGADVSVMTGFREWFGHGQLLRLEQTFRCPQELCDASSRFVSRNPAQIEKAVRSVAPARGPVLQAFQVPDRNRLQNAVDGHLARLYQDLVDGTALPGRGGKVSVFILGRYNADRSYLPVHWKARYGDRMDISFLSAHRSKGAEADYVILPGMVRKGFPNLRPDDPVLALAMPNGDTYPLGEERRLFYVALTRARRCVTMFTVRGQASPFLDELVKDGAVTVVSTEGEPVEEERCPVCKHGVIVPRNGPYGPFRSCSSYPKCEHRPRKKPAR
jgi:DNA helicase-4